MENLICNQNNWTGNNMTVRVHKREGDTQKFEVFSNVFVAVHAPYCDPDTKSMDHDSFMVYEADDTERKFPVVESYKFRGNKEYTATQKDSGLCGLSRDHEHPLLAAAQVIANIY